MTSSVDRILTALDRLVAFVGHVSRWLALAAGVLLLAAVGLIVAEVVLRGVFGHSIGGAHELSGYVMALAASWSFAYALVEKAHIRIDVLYLRLPPMARIVLDILALSALALVSSLIVVHAWGVLATTLKQGSLANTPLQTPLWIPQTLWFAGFAWFAVAVAVLLVTVLARAMRRDLAVVARIAGSKTLIEEIAESGLATRGRDRGSAGPSGGEGGT